MHYPRTVIAALLVFGIIGILFSFVLTHDHYVKPTREQILKSNNSIQKLSRSVCGKDTSLFNCQKIADSRYSTMEGVPIALFGLCFFIFITLFFIGIIICAEKDRPLLSSLLFMVIIAGALVDVMLFLISIYSVGALCPLCTATYLALWGFLALFTVTLKKQSIHPFIEIAGLRFLFSNRSFKQLINYSALSMAVLVLSAGAGYGVKRFYEKMKHDLINEKQEQMIEAILKRFASSSATALKLPDAPFIGNPSAAITIHDFSDFFCPACADAAKVLDAFVAEKPERVRLIHVNFPLDTQCNDTLRKGQIHEGSCLLARGSFCAADQGKFREYYTAAFNKKNKKPGMKDALNIATAAGLDVNQFQNCISSPAADNRLREQIGLAKKLHINSTPTIFINGKLYTDLLHPKILEKLMAFELQQIEKKIYSQKQQSK